MSQRLIVGLVACLMTFTWGMHGPISTDAQEATPRAETTGVEVAPGVTFDLVPVSEDPPYLYRLRFAPGATLSFADDPAISLVYVESGSLSLQLDAAVSDARTDPEAEEEEDAGTAVTLSEGDYFVLPPLVAGEIRSDGQQPMSIVIAAITPGLIPGTAIGTPAPE